ncbi:MAG: hypothetical protein COX80_03110 [Candidatus Magasanikbacteria bacterium CG_4_10_14_0_2_um_filter_33_14]|uniref:Uncharacterized protein n=1 Tax=Candidatus Magasanikbacteria bacterium CG_4_10_14_0_2_um_filter_33_14 TaxID=1974636 RepID=A0A2M7VAB8_9BACT|nr:MAG: hypothetical protein COX80_03110 [Candidatus Magasanikbacteria bacterium CG_4_10_14_0_2_um_filter_33_14]
MTLGSTNTKLFDDLACTVDTPSVQISEQLGGQGGDHLVQRVVVAHQLAQVAKRLLVRGRSLRGIAEVSETNLEFLRHRRDSALGAIPQIEPVGDVSVAVTSLDQVLCGKHSLNEKVEVATVSFLGKLALTSLPDIVKGGVQHC